MDVASPRDLLRHLKKGEVARVNFVELFFDLVFVFALTEVSHFLLHHLDIGGVLQGGVLFLAIWWAWICTAWVTNWLDPALPTVRLALFVLMLAGLFLSTSVPASFGELGLVFAGAYVFIQVGRSLFAMWAMRGHDRGNYETFARLTAWFLLSAIFWIAGGLAEGETRLALWALGMAIELVSPAVGYRTPWLGASRASDWHVDGDHMAERCALFVIIALGETVLTAGATFAELSWDVGTVAAFVVIFASTAALWWIYFGFVAGSARRRIVDSDNPGRIARFAYTYLHLPMAAGIIIAAVGFELILVHPEGQSASFALVLSLVAGTGLYVAAVTLFKWSIAGRIPPSHVFGLGALLTLGFLGQSLTPLALGTLAATILVLVAAAEFLTSHGADMLHSAD